MKPIVIISTAIALTLTSQFVAAAPITDNYADGDPLTATTMNNIKAAVNDNDTNVGTNATAIGDNATSIGTNTGDISTNATATGNNATSIGTNTGDISTNGINIGINSSDIGINSSAITDHENRITVLEAAPGGTITRTISIPAGALSFTGADITVNPAGLLWNFNFGSVARFIVRKPFDYSGGSITMSLIFQPTTATLGVVQFFIRAESFNSGDVEFDPTSNGGTPVNVAGTTGFGTYFEQNFTIPSTRLAQDWWMIKMQRQGSSATYPDPVKLIAVSLEYTAS